MVILLDLTLLITLLCYPSQVPGKGMVCPDSSMLDVTLPLPLFTNVPLSLNIVELYGIYLRTVKFL